jgi:hypothetical protein
MIGIFKNTIILKPVEITFITRQKVRISATIPVQVRGSNMPEKIRIARKIMLRNILRSVIFSAN